MVHVSSEMLPSVYKVVSNRIRRKMIQLLRLEKMTYLELLISTGLDWNRHHGWFDYHLKVLLDERIITREEDQYLLTDSGKGIARLLDTIEGESQKLFRKEVKPMKMEESVAIQKAPNISIEEIPDSKLTINLEHPHPLWKQGELRIYKETASVPPEVETAWGRNNYAIHTCLERTWFPKKCEYHYLILYETYASKYDGTEENRTLASRTEEGYFLDNWAKVWEIQKHDGLYETKRISWGGRWPTAEPEEEVMDPPEKILRLPYQLRIGDELSKTNKMIVKGEERGEVVSKERILGEYKLTIGEKEHYCLLSRSVATFFLQKGRSWKRVWELFRGIDGVSVLSRRYDTGTWLERHEYKNWEKCPTLTHEGETYYLGSEDYLAERYIPPVNLGRIKG